MNCLLSEFPDTPITLHFLLRSLLGLVFEIKYVASVSTKKSTALLRVQCLLGLLKSYLDFLRSHLKSPWALSAFVCLGHQQLFT